LKSRKSRIPKKRRTRAKRVISQVLSVWERDGWAVFVRRVELDVVVGVGVEEGVRVEVRIMVVGVAGGVVMAVVEVMREPGADGSNRIAVAMMLFGGTSNCVV